MSLPEHLWDVVIQSGHRHDEQMISALTEAVTYRRLLQVALAHLHAEQLLRTRAEQRLKQAMGIENWHQDAS